MTPARLAEVLEALADGPPWDTAWLRSLLPELAVRGRLVAQEAGDRQEEGNSQSAMPRGWDLRSLAAVVGSKDRVSDGPFGSKLKKSHYTTSGRRVLRLGNIGVGEFKNADQSFVSEEYFAELDRYHLESGDVLVASLGDRPGRACLVPDEVLPALNKADCFRVRVDSDRLSNQFLVHALNSDSVSAIAGDLKRGDTRGRITLSHLRGLPIPVPPLAEQHRIVAKVDELMGHAAVVESRHLAASSARVRFRDAALHALAEAEDHEAVKKAWSRIEDHFDDLFTEPEDIQPLRQTILQLAVRGRLVAQEAGEEAQEIGCSESSMPTSWRLARFEECARVASCLVDPADHGQAVHVAPDTIEPATGRLLECRTILEDKVTSAKHKFFEGQILYSKIRPALSKCVIAPFDGLCSADMYPIETTQVVRYLQLTILSKDFVSTASAMANRVKMPKINKVELGSIPIPLPPLAEQHRIVAKVDELMALCDTLETSLARAKTTREQFATSISHALTTQA